MTKIINKEIDKDIKNLILIGVIIFFIISLTLKNLYLSLRLFLAYLTFIYLPPLLFVSKIKNLSLIEKFLLINLIGFSISAVYVLIDIIFKIPLTNITFLIITFSIFILSFLITKTKIP